MICSLVLAVFSQDSKYLGCYKDASNRDLPNYNNLRNGNDVQKCVEVCKSKGKVFLTFKYKQQFSIVNSLKQQPLSDSLCFLIFDLRIFY